MLIPSSLFPAALTEHPAVEAADEQEAHQPASEVLLRDEHAHEAQQDGLRRAGDQEVVLAA